MVEDFPSTIDRDQLLDLLVDGAEVTLVEAQGSMYYRDGHLPGAINLPPDQVNELAQSLLPRRDGRIVVYCSNPACPNSAAVAEELSAIGYGHVSIYPGGKQDWVEAGYPIERDA